MRRLILARQLVLLSFVKAALSLRWDRTIELFLDGNVPGEANVSIGCESWVYDSGDGAHVYNVSVPTLYYIAGSHSASGVSVIVAPGGGYVDLAIEKEGFDVAERFISMGFAAVFVLKYRVPERPDVVGLPKWWAPLQDAQRSIEYVRYHAAAFGLDPNRVGFAGFSAGGNLAARISTAFDPLLYEPMDDIDYVSRRTDFSVAVYPWKIINENHTALAPEVDNITSATPPFFLVHAADDDTAPFLNSLLFFQRLITAGISNASLEVGPSAGHGFAVCQYLDALPFPIVCDWPDRFRNWLIAELRILRHTASPPSDNYPSL